MQDYGYYGPESVTWKIGREAAILLGGARAVLMQLAHPLVAMGVSEHSDYMSDPYGRTWNTFLLGQMLTFGSSATALRAARTINRLHKHVHGTLPAQAGAYSSGTPYDARDPELLLWVHATLVDTILLMYPLLVGPLSASELEQYYQESKASGRLLGLSPAQMPSTVRELLQYINDMVHSNRLAATPQARRLAQQVLFPPAPRTIRPLLHLNLQLTCALLPQPIRAIYGLEWGNWRQHAFDVSTWSIRTVMPHLPTHLRELPITRYLMEQGESRWPLRTEVHLQPK
jgi:uncharacterized protein (DUF2236 family)